MDESCITRAISLCKKNVSSFSYSWRKQRELAEVQIQLGLPAHQLITESSTRWGSRQQMFQRVLEQETALSKVLSTYKKFRHLILTWQDIEVLEAVQKVLKPSQMLFQVRSMSPFPTSNLCCTSSAQVSLHIRRLIVSSANPSRPTLLTCWIWPHLLIQDQI